MKVKHFLILFITQMEKGISKIRERCYQKVIFIMNGSTKIAIHASIFAIFLITVTKYLRKKGGISFGSLFQFIPAEEKCFVSGDRIQNDSLST